ncbi:MAG: hypothetical protein KJ956_14880, partial [Actinobacteria bacterium]|nr:hypothetical protein [Actinomycetota bacterium]
MKWVVLVIIVFGVALAILWYSGKQEEWEQNRLLHERFCQSALVVTETCGWDSIGATILEIFNIDDDPDGWSVIQWDGIDNDVYIDMPHYKTWCQC